MLKRRWIAILLAVMFAFTSFCCIFAQTSKLPLPPLLEKATATGGWSSACPARSAKEQAMIDRSSGFVSSLEVAQKLRDQFPNGSSSDRLASALVTQGFILGEPCEADSTVRRAHYRRPPAGLSEYGVMAVIYWKVDAHDKIVWSKASVSYMGL